MSRFYDRKGNPLSLTEWATSRHEDKRVAETTLPGGAWISTVWLGVDHSFGGSRPVIFETMVFPSAEDMSERDCERYSTEEEARAGHERMVAKWSGPHAPKEAK